MFVQQGARQFEIWTGKPAPEDEMLRVVIHALRQQAEEAETAAAAVPAKKVPAPKTAAKKATPAKKKAS
jgi:3-dehydroquinate dehydratase/shikimate dehydrogenase